ncbi:hypothetical protein CRENPOLYSF2_1090001 [Crenothrix polyspora]|uniref:Uncharacterized protein n=1 Tax=Crenothrix polyspora TaxID=360316 RepID=A0A1R4GZ67_9GAMM|nr:hypothetical protein CRENPOLYSF2_1090001 [Crenothrix polyspora]
MNKIGKNLSGIIDKLAILIIIQSMRIIELSGLYDERAMTCIHKTLHKDSYNRLNFGGLIKNDWFLS